MSRPVDPTTALDWFHCPKCVGITQHRLNKHGASGLTWRCRWCKSWRRNPVRIEDSFPVTTSEQGHNDESDGGKGPVRRLPS